jgi:hypothetical protein
MGKGKHYWETERSLAICQAYIAGGEDGSAICGADQQVEVFWNGKVVPELRKRLPDPCPLDHFYKRRWDSIRNHFRDTVAKDVQKFNKALLVIYNSNPTRVTEQQKVNMAVAYHLGEAARMDYTYKDYDAKKWKFYRCWLVLKKTRKFLPPQRLTKC